MYAIHKFYETKYIVLGLTDTHCQCLMPGNPSHTFFVAEWIPRDILILVKPSQPGNYFSCKFEDVLETASEKLGQLHLK